MRPAPVVDSLLDLIGETPILALRNIPNPAGARVWVKAENLNPGGSVKDRICIAMIEDAERQGRLRPGQTVVEPTSGNTGIGLCLVCAKKGFPLVLTMPESMSLERRQLLQAYGAELVLTPADQSMQGAMRAAEKIAEEREAFMPQQFANPSNPAVHETKTGPEILKAFGTEAISILVAAAGTGGTISGVARAFKAHGHGTRFVAVEASASPVLSGGKPGPTKVQGINTGFVPDNFDRTQCDEIRQVSDEQAFAMKRRLAREEGLLVGMSSGANVHVACELANALGPNEHVLTILCDTGERYFSLNTYFSEHA